MNKTACILLILALWVAPCFAEMEITPFRINNQSPLVQIFGLPAQTAASIVPRGRLQAAISQDVASNYSVSSNARERIMLDGESYRWTLSARYGLGEQFEVGAEIPYVLYGGGFLDSFIIDWHKTFGLPQGGRNAAPKNRPGLVYIKDGVQKLRMDHSQSGIGDISLNGGYQLYRLHENQSRDDLALRVAVKFPTGDSGSLRGSGSTDFSLYLCGSMSNATEWGTLGIFGAVGGMATTKGDVLADQQNRLAGFGNAGFGWGPTDWISFKLQLDAHTAMFHGSALNELSKSTLMLVTGGAVKLPGDYLLDIGVTEDVAVSTSPDVVFHLGLSKQF